MASSASESSENRGFSRTICDFRPNKTVRAMNKTVKATHKTVKATTWTVNATNKTVEATNKTAGTS